MSRNKMLAKKVKLVKAGSVAPAPRWADIRAFGLKRARTRRIRVKTRNWRREKLKV